MNWAQFKDPVPYLCLAGAVVVSWSLTQEEAGSNFQAMGSSTVGKAWEQEVSTTDNPRVEASCKR